MCNSCPFKHIRFLDKNAHKCDMLSLKLYNVYIVVYSILFFFKKPFRRKIDSNEVTIMTCDGEDAKSYGKLRR